MYLINHFNPMCRAHLSSAPCRYPLYLWLQASPAMYSLPMGASRLWTTVLSTPMGQLE